MAFALIVTGVIAQETGGMTSKKGEAILPEADDWALSIDAVPVLNYLGNILNGATATNSSPAFGYPGTPLAITGKMFKDEKTAYRAMIRLGFGSTTMNNYVDDNVNTTDPTVMVSDSWKAAYNQIVLGGGLEMRRGKTRLQGFYGGMLMFGIGGGKDTYTYGNAITTTNKTPTSTVWTPTIIAGPATTRTLENKAGGSFMLGLRGFIGAEYFIFPKMSIGAEFGWGLGMSSTGEGEVKSETWDTVSNAVKATTAKTGKSGTFGLDTDVNGTQMIPAASLNLTLHF